MQHLEAPEFEWTVQMHIIRKPGPYISLFIASLVHSQKIAYRTGDLFHRVPFHTLFGVRCFFFFYAGAVYGCGDPLYPPSSLRAFCSSTRRGLSSL